MEIVELDKEPEEILNDPLLNKGIAFSQEERDSLGLNGLLPFHVATIEEQLQRRYKNFCEYSDPFSKYIYLSALQNRNEVLFYRLISEHLSEMLPLIYTPTVGDVSIQYSSQYREHRGLYLAYPFKDRLEQIIQSYPKQKVDVIVVTDGERILGLGDLGVGGMAIPVGKLALYTLFGGIHPERTLPIHLDVGTNNPQLLKDPLYVGWRHERITGKEYDDFINAFVKAIKRRYPQVLLQWEDFAKPHAKPLLDRYRDEICSFNDDIQGTAAVTLAALFSAVQCAKEKLSDQKIALLGGGSAGIGICNEIVRAMKEEGLTEREACSRFYVVDLPGLLHNQLERIDENQKKYVRDSQELQNWKVKDRSKITLLEVIQNARPSILIGVSTQAGAFTEEIVTAMAQFVKRPIIFPLSNPTAKSEAKPEDLLRWTQGKAIIATGSPFPPVDYQGKLHAIAQCNNVYIFPGIGLGIIASKAQKVTDEMFLKASHVLSKHSPMLQDPFAALFPPVEKLRNVSREIGIAIAKLAQEQGVAPSIRKDEIEQIIDQNMWYPEYKTYCRARVNRSKP